MHTAGEGGRVPRILGAPPITADQPLSHKLLQRAGDLLCLPGWQLSEVQLVQASINCSA